MKKDLLPRPLSKMFREEDRRIYSTNNYSLRRQAKYHTEGISLFSDTQLKQSKKQTGQNLSAFLYGAVWDDMEVVFAPGVPPCVLFWLASVLLADLEPCSAHFCGRHTGGRGV